MILMMVWGYQFSHLLQWKKEPQCVYVGIVPHHHHHRVPAPVLPLHLHQQSRCHLKRCLTQHQREMTASLLLYNYHKVLINQFLWSFVQRILPHHQLKVKSNTEIHSKLNAIETHCQMHYFNYTITDVKYLHRL